MVEDVRAILNLQLMIKRKKAVNGEKEVDFIITETGDKTVGLW